MAFYRDTFTRISLPMVRAQMKPARFREAKLVRLEKYGFEVEVQLTRVPSPTSFGRERVFFVCPRLGCSSLVNVVGCAMWIGWGCTKCLRWRGRNRRRVGIVPLVSRRPAEG
jgi:hypothetical protein